MAFDPVAIQKILTWYDTHGRSYLPWSITRDPYLVWVSEIMLQQTQVQTVIPYFERFIARFPDIRTLALASQDHVLQYWAGLGYYARGRNLHRAAQMIHEKYQDQLPADLEQILELPGIGRSTAGAIYSFAFNQPAAILDGNVKRVLVRILGITQWPDQSDIKNYLWDQADQAILALKKYNQHRAGDYTQAMMDLGALICTPKNPSCSVCPLQADCQAFRTQQVHQLPVRRPERRAIRANQLRLVRQFFIFQSDDDQVVLYQRPQKSVWGGLWAFPHENLNSNQKLSEITTRSKIDLVKQIVSKKHGLLNHHILDLVYLSAFEHVFTHFTLILEPIMIRLKSDSQYGLNSRSVHRLEWVYLQALNTREWALPKPIRQIVQSLVNGVQ